MRKNKVTAAVFGLLLCWAAPAGAGVIVDGSAYTINLFAGGGFSNLYSPAVPSLTLTFDGLPETFNLRFGGTVTVNESQTDLGNGMHRIDFLFLADAEIFPNALNPNNRRLGATNIGRGGGNANPLDFVTPVKLTSAILTYTRGNGAQFGPFESIGSVPNPDPWDGYYNGPASGFGFINSVGTDVRTIDLSFTTMQQPVPEPASMAIFGFGALGLAGIRRRARSAQTTAQAPRTSKVI